MIAALLCATLFAHNQDAPRITVEQRALVGSLAFPRIGELFGERVEAGPDVGDDVVFIALRSATFDEFRDKVASALNVSWKQIDNKWRVHRTNDQRQADFEDMIRRRNEAVARDHAAGGQISPLTPGQLDELDQIARVGTVNEVLGVGYEQDLDIGDRLMSRLVSSMSVSDLCSVPPGVRRTWALGDSRFEALPNLKALVAKYEQEWAQVNAVLTEHRFFERAMEDPDSPTVNALYKWMFGGGPVLDRVYVSVTGRFDKVLLEVVAFDQDGWQVLRDGHSLGDLATTGWVPKLREGLEPAPRDERTARILESFADDDIPRLIAAVTDLVADMPLFDPWAMDASSILLSYSRQMESDVIVQFDDAELANELGMFELEGEDGSADPVPLRAGLSWLARFVQLGERDGMLIGRPPTAEPFRATLDRKTVGSYVRSARVSRTVDLDRLGDVLKGAPTLADKELTFLTLIPHWNLGLTAAQDVSLFALYGSLSQGQRLAARSPGGFRSRLSTFGPGLTNDLREQFLEESNWRSFVEAFFTSYGDEPRYPDPYLPEGVADDRPHVSDLTLGIDFHSLASRAEADLRITTKTEVVGAKWSYGILQEWTIGQLARMYVRRLKSSRETGQEMIAEYEFYVASKASIEANVYLGGRKIKLDPCNIVLGLDAPEGLKFDQLPESVKAEFWNIVRAEQRDGG